MCLEDVELYSASCEKCNYCEDCLLGWIEEKLSNDKLLVKIPCLIEGCEAKIIFQDIHNYISKKLEPKL